jgi:hypothetical protein
VGDHAVHGVHSLHGAHRAELLLFKIFGMQINTGTGIGLVIGILKTEEMFGKR